MQLSLTPAVPPRGRASPDAAAGLARPSRDAAMAQLDRLEALNGPPRSAHRLSGAATWLALVGGCVVLMGASMLRPSNEAARPASTPVTMADAAPKAPGKATLDAASTLAPALPAQAEAPTALAAAPVDMTALAPQAATTPADAADAALTDEAARKARLRAEKRKAGQLAQERASAEEAARVEQVAARRAEEQRAAEEERQRIAAVEKSRHVAVAMPAQTPVHRSVGEVCSSGGFFAENACRARECARAESRDDPVCVRLRDIEESRRSASLYR